jgi:hypothetical protein
MPFADNCMDRHATQKRENIFNIKEDLKRGFLR